MSIDKNNRIRSTIWWWLATVLGLFALVRVSGQLFEVVRLSSRLKQSSDAIIELESKKQEMERQLILESSSEFMEKQIREQLALAKEGEVVLMLPSDMEDVIAKLKNDDSKQEPARNPYWKEWVKLIFR